MSGRDLLYKPQIPTVLPDDASGAKKVDKAGVKGPSGRDLGTVGETRPGAPAGAPPPAERVGRPQAFKAAYFNRDISGVHEVNQRASGMRALRGSEGASDLRKVVLPPAVGVEHPEPAVLRGATDLMGLAGEFELCLESFIGRQGTWARAKGVTLEMIRERLAQLEAMVEARRQALARMAANRRGKPAGSVTVSQANTVAGGAMEAVEDLAAEGRELVTRTAEQAEGMHRRLAKMLGIKRRG